MRLTSFWKIATVEQTSTATTPSGASRFSRVSSSKAYSVPNTVKKKRSRM
jgi:hypothetical protein